MRLVVLLVLMMMTMPFRAAADGGAPLPPSVAEMARATDAIVFGRVVSAHSRWDGPIIVTDYTLDVRVSVYGQHHRLVVTVEGGEVGDFGMRATHVPHLTVGEETLLFLHKMEDQWRVWGGEQGHFRVVDGWAIRESTDEATPLVDLMAQVVDSASQSDRVLSLPPDWKGGLPAPVSSPPESVWPEDFVYQGFHWPGPSPMGEPYVVNTAGNEVPSADFLQAVRNAAANWTNVSSSYFVFPYGGTTSIGSAGFDGHNVVVWGSLEAGVLGRTTWWYYSSTGEIVEADMVLNTYYNWATGSVIPADRFDVESVALHEFGHWLSLGHDNNPAAVMYPSLSPGAKKRVGCTRTTSRASPTFTPRACQHQPRPPS